MTTEQLKPDRAITDLIEKYSSDFNDLGQIVVEQQNETGRKDGRGGAKIKAYLLNEDHVVFLGTLLRNSPITVKFKKVVVQEFAKVRAELDALRKEKSTPEYDSVRLSGKTLRLAETAEIKKLVEYAQGQGSKNADKYYMNLTRMVNLALFVTEQRFGNLREVMTTEQLMVVGAADGIVGKAVSDGIRDGLYYKEIYKLAKKRIDTFAELHGQTEIVRKQLEMF